MSKINAVLIFCISLTVATTARQTTTCYTPDRAVGHCVAASRCSLLRSVAETLTPVEAVNYLQTFQCGFEGIQMKVCCACEVTNNDVAQETSLLSDVNECGIHPYIVCRNRTAASLQEFPWLVALQYTTPKGRTFSCGGSLINKRFVLTSAHCVKRIPETWNLVSIRLGEYDFNSPRDCMNIFGHGICSSPPIDVPIAEKIVHELYDVDDYSQPHDIALIKLAREIQFSDYVRPICLPPRIQQRNQHQMTVTGWGLPSDVYPSKKFKSMVEEKPYDFCLRTYKELDVHLQNQICLQEIGGCTADVGGPLTVNLPSSTGFNWYLVGIKSFGPTPCGNHNWPDIYTRVADYYDWIIKHIHQS